jgi:hypothetical protein
MKRSCLAITLSASTVLLAGCAQSFSNFSSNHTERASAQTVSSRENLRRAKQLAWEAAVLVQNPPHSVERWQEARLKWRQAVRLLESIPSQAADFPQAQKKLADYRKKSEVINQRLTDETLAADNFEQAQKVAWQAAILVQDPPHRLEIWQRSLERWERATRLMGAIPPLTTVAAAAQTKRDTYRQNYQAIVQRIQSEQVILATLNQFTDRVNRLNAMQTKALTGQTEDPIGITYEDYQQVVRSLQALETQVKALPAAKTNPAVAEMQTAIADYKFALTLWQTYERHKAANADWLQNSDFFNRLVPLSLIDSDRLLARYDVKVFPGSRETKVPLKSTVWAIWEKAAEHARATQQKVASLQ